ncbi:unnamed protein product, partial [Durusdinium trenchii]
DSLGPSCGPNNQDLCDEAKKAQLEDYMNMPIGDLRRRIEEEEALSAKADEELAELLKKLQAQYEEGQKARDQKQKEIKDAGLKLMKTVQAHRKHLQNEL